MSGGQRASDYVLEPCVAMPEITAAPDQRDWGQPVDGIGVLSEKGMWVARAKAAEDAADKLAESLRTIDPIMRSNYLGDNCAEGEVLRTLVRDQIGKRWANEVEAQIERLHSLAQTCIVAASRLSEADRASANEISE